MTATADPTRIAALDPTATTVGVVVCTHRLERLPLLQDAVRSLAVQTRRHDRVLVVVDGDDALAAAVRAALPTTEVLALGSNHGVSHARTVGARALDTDLVAFLDDDAEALPGWLEPLVGVVAEEGVLGAGGRSEPVYLAPRPRWLPEEFLWTLGCSYRGQGSTRREVRNVYGGCAVLRREAFVALGGFDAAIGHRGRFVGGGEEAEYGLRARRALGGSFAYEPAAGIRHRIPPERLTRRYVLGRCVAEGRMKARLAELDPAALGPERTFALALLPAVLRALVRPVGGAGRSSALGLVAGALAVVLGLALGRSSAGAGSTGEPMAERIGEPMEEKGRTS